jgi:hypothetical protein
LQLLVNAEGLLAAPGAEWQRKPDAFFAQDGTRKPFALHSLSGSQAGRFFLFTYKLQSDAVQLWYNFVPFLCQTARRRRDLA